MDDRDERRITTVRQVAEAGGLIVFCCWRCNRKVEIDPGSLVARFGDRVVAAVRGRCTRCEEAGLPGLPYIQIRWPDSRKMPLTLRGLERAGVAITIKCRACRRWTLRQPHWYQLWIREYAHGADDMSLDELRPRLTCSCGSRAATIVIDTGLARDQYKAS